jgi:dipeptidyl-peptidase-4
MAGASLWMHSLAEKGYIVFTLDGRGSSNRGLEFEQAVHGDLGILETEDQMKGVAHLSSLPYIDSDRMAIHGWSFGGFMTLNLMLRHPEVFKVGVAGGAVTDWRFYEIMYTERYMDEPKDNAAGYEATRMPVLADRLEGKLMMIHGSSDDVVVPQHCMVMLNAFINADKQVDFFMYPGHKHNVRGPDRVHLITKIIDYVEQHL